MIDALIWFIVIEFLSLIFLPVTFLLFKNLPDRGYAFGKAISILLISFVLWFLSSIHVLPNTRWAIILVVMFFAVCSFFLFRRHRAEIMEYLSKNRTVIIVTEAVFVAAFVLYGVVRAYNPEIVFTEKPMDFAFLNAIIRSDYFPPNDPWLSGFSLNNYYFGHMIMATLTKLTGIQSAVTFNLSLVLVFALAAIGVFSIVYNLVRLFRGGVRAAIGFGLAAATFLLIIGNLEGILELLYAHGVGSDGFWSWIGIRDLTSPYDSSQWYPTQFWWWWRATRMIQVMSGDVCLDYTIAEFPNFTFILGDLHAHLMSLPFVLLSLAVCLNIFVTKEYLNLAWLRRNILPFLLMIICIGSLGAIHTWDLPIYVFIFVIIIMIQVYIKRSGSKYRWLLDGGVLSVISVTGVILFYLPFYLNLNLRDTVSGIVPWNGPNTRPFFYFMVWGLFLFIGVSFVLAHVRGLFKAVSWRKVLLVLLIVMLPWIIWAIAEAATDGGSSIGGKLGHLVPLIIILALTLLIAIRKIAGRKAGENSALFASVLLFTAVLLTVGCELFYIRDVFNNRMNTVFRFYFQAWILLSIASSFAIYYLYRVWKTTHISGKVTKACWWCLLAILIGCSLTYPVSAVFAKTSSFSAIPTLDGTAWHRSIHAEEWEAISWMNKNIDGDPVIVTAPGGAYTDHGIVSEFTGLPTVLGWEGHEYVWRGTNRDYAGRREDIQQIYTSTNASLVQELLGKYDVSYVYVGRLETEMYGADAGAGLRAFMDVPFEINGVVLYQVKE